MVIQSQGARAQNNHSGSGGHGNAGSVDALEGLEFHALLDELTMRINADYSTHEPVPGVDVYMERPARIVPRRAPLTEPLPERRRGVSTNLTAAIISLAMAAGTGWLYLGL